MGSRETLIETTENFFRGEGVDMPLWVIGLKIDSLLARLVGATGAKTYSVAQMAVREARTKPILTGDQEAACAS